MPSSSHLIKQLKRGMVWCPHCGRACPVDSNECLKTEWPQCCGETMTLDSPEERAEKAKALAALAALGSKI